MEYKASNWMYPITISNALLGLVLGPFFITSQKIHITVSLGTLLYGLFFLWGTIVYTKYPVYIINGKYLEITRMFRKNKVINLSEIDKSEEARKTFFFLYNGKIVNVVSSALIGNKKYIELVIAIKRVITNHSSTPLRGRTR